MNNYKKIGILGGMGAEATADFYMRIIRLFRERLGAKTDADFPEFVINSIPCHIVEVSSNEDRIRTFLVEGCKLLESAGVDFIVIPCNSAHKHIDEMQSAVKVPVISVLQETAIAVKTKGLSCVLVLGVGYTVENRLFDTILAKNGIRSTAPSMEEISALDQICLNVVSGKGGAKEKKILLDIINKHTEAQGAILGCTEFPLVIKQEDTATPIFDTLHLLAEATFRHATGKNI